MGEFHKQPFKSRLGQMGDASEAAFDALFPSHHKLGLNRPPLNVAMMSLPARYTPDRMVHDRFVECMGIGKDQTLKIKREKLDALFKWSVLDPVDLFVFDSHRNLWWRSPLLDWFAQCQAHGVAAVFPEGKEYIALHSDFFPGEAQPHEQS